MRDTPEWMSGRTDVLLAAAVSVLVQLSVWRGNAPDETFANRPLSSAILLTVTLALVWRRRAPFVVAFVASSGVLLQALATQTFAQSPALALYLVIALYSLGAHASTRRALAGGVYVAAALVAKVVFVPMAVADDSPFVALFWWLVVLSVVGLGMLVRSIRRAADMQHRAQLLEEERAAHAREVVAVERQRIARELHDVVSHNVSASILQAGAARELLRTNPDRADRALLSVQEMGREAIAEMRRMLGVMRGADDVVSSIPQPRLSDLSALVARENELGLPTELIVDGPLDDLAPGIELSAYRIVQEALTNARKHANANRAIITLRRSDAWFEVEVDDDGNGTSPSDDHPGHGLVGMRERVALFGGELASGSLNGRGFTVRAKFPTTSDAS